MQGRVRLAAAVCAAVLCAASAAFAQNPNRVTVRAMLGGSNEVPAVSAGAHGEAVVTVDRGAGTIDYEVNIFNLPSGIVGSHIHVGTAGVNGPIVINFPVAAVGQSGAFQLKGSARASELVARPEAGVRFFEEAAFAIASGAAYVNVHTQANPGGEIRGQLCPESALANTFNGVALCTQPPRR
ncbi:hypothetical protein TBR22_A52580 [Luteitalea sp. TBR-22]|uniref:CHRD domain-containing protein n=1 Tax=Luteitalea sp. TBR-22 TaxID=2802971 RepID=UPI001AF25A90|nr:CHRD domain-containing protein [Luteitalea sp. TBR-22]BCS36021.1 hypothetical protein TBR22_A52580 [Luteitalea sp. TBR-22]